VLLESPHDVRVEFSDCELQSEGSSSGGPEDSNVWLILRSLPVTSYVRTVCCGLRSGAALAAVRLDVVPLPPLGGGGSSLHSGIKFGRSRRGVFWGEEEGSR
jgi:hypothetical protein